jgi:uncharacterized protein (DUF305 family)
MEQMINQFYMSDQYAVVAETKATHDELRAFACNFSARQQAEIQMMQEWLLTWFNINYTPQTDCRFAGRFAIFNAQNGMEFDAQYIEIMIIYENQELYLAQQAISCVGQPDLKDLAADIVQVNSLDLQNLNCWFNTWSFCTD